MMPPEIEQAFIAWHDSLSEGWWDDAGDAGGILDSLEEAFAAGWNAARAAEL